jgi:hypothetical protein
MSLGHGLHEYFGRTFLVTSLFLGLWYRWLGLLTGKKIKEALTNLLDGKTALMLTMIAVSPAVIVLGSAS